MATSAIPKGGLTLLRTPENNQTPSSGVPPQVIRLSLTQKVTDEIVKSLQNEEKISIRFGQRITIQNGKKSYPVFSYPEKIPSEIYRPSPDRSDTLYFSGKLSHRLERQKAKSDTTKSDEALATLQQSLQSYEQEKTSNEARIVTDKNELRYLNEASQNTKTLPANARKERFLNTIGRPSSPFLGSANSPGIGPLSARSVPCTVDRDQIRLNAIKTPFLHLLATKPLDCQSIVKTLHATSEDCRKLLLKYAKDGGEGDGPHELKELAYRELDVYKFQYRSQAIRQLAIDRAISAFDRKRISTNDSVWDLLLPVEKRGKGKGSELSKLRLGQAGQRGQATTTEPATEHIEGVADADGSPQKKATKAKATTTKAKQRASKVEDPDKVAGQPALSSKEVKGPPSDKKTVGKGGKKTPSTGKFKSAEMIEDSDEELEPTASTTKPAEVERGSTLNAAAAHPSKSLAGSTSKKSATASASRQGGASGTLMPETALGRRAEGINKKASPRSRTDSSPSKPSPLGSSPPQNATDLDKSHSLEAENTFSAGSSQTDRARKAQAAQSSTPLSKPTNLKRKAPEQSSSAPKRQQVVTNGSHVARPITNGVSNKQVHNHSLSASSSNASTLGQRSRTPSSSASDSTATATTSASISKLGEARHSDLRAKSRRFKGQYDRYQTIHEKVMATAEDKRDEEEVKKLRRMHTRIKELKEEIWQDWKKQTEKDKARVNGTGDRGLKRAI